MKDMISKLPTEIALLIFTFVGLKDSYKSLSVCKSWRDILNCPYVWNYFYQIYDLEQIGGSEYLLDRRNFGKALSPLCPQAIDAQKFLGSPAFNWRTGKWLDLNLHLRFRVSKIVCHEPYLVFYYYQRKEIHIYCCLERVFRLVNIVTIIFNIITEMDESETKIKISPKYFLLGFYNLTLVFKLSFGKFMFYRVYSIEENLEVVCSDNSFDIFVEQHCRKDMLDYERYLVDDMLWLTNRTSLKQIINLSNGEVKSILMPYFTEEMKQPYLIHHSNKSVLITNSNGTEVSSFSIPYAEKVFYMNSHFVLVHFPDKYKIECRLIKTGELFNTMLVRKQTKAIVHPKKDIIYLLSTVNNHFNLISLCARTRTKIWRYKGKECCSMSWCSFIYLINERYLLIHPAPSSKFNFALFSLSGELIHEGLYPQVCKRMMTFFSSSFFITKEIRDHIHVYCYS